MNIEKQIGIETYLTNYKGIGGKLRFRVEDFIVEEISYKPIETKGKYTIAKIKVYNWETFKLVNEISKKLKISRNLISFAGTKDKRAITTQLFSIRDKPENVEKIDLQDVEISQVYNSNKKIEIGDLIGNHFKIKIRELDLEKEKVKEIVNNISNEIVKTGGFPNFFGVQRFGSLRPITHLVGERIVNGDFEGAVLTFIANPMNTESDEVYEARKFIEETRDFKEGLKIYPKFLNFERAMLNYLITHPGDFKGTFCKLPKNLTLMFVHAYQSFLFNKILSIRMKKGIPINEPAIGDICLPIEKNGTINRKTWIEVKKMNYEKVKKKVKEGKAVVSGILFGFESEFTNGEQGEIERKIIEKEGIKKEGFIVPKIRELSSKGTRREIIAPLKKIDCSVNENVTLEFQLSKGCYATSLLREFMKSEDLMSY